MNKRANKTGLSLWLWIDVLPCCWQLNRDTVSRLNRLLHNSLTVPGSTCRRRHRGNECWSVETARGRSDLHSNWIVSPFFQRCSSKHDPKWKSTCLKKCSLLVPFSFTLWCAKHFLPRPPGFLLVIFFFLFFFYRIYSGTVWGPRDASVRPEKWLQLWDRGHFDVFLQYGLPPGGGAWADLPRRWKKNVECPPSQMCRWVQFEVTTVMQRYKLMS